jgi:hypothetical protein
MAARSTHHGVPLRVVLWRNALNPAAAPSLRPPPWEPGTWQITRFDVLEDGAILWLWYEAIPARPAEPAERPANHVDLPLPCEIPLTMSFPDGRTVEVGMVRLSDDGRYVLANAVLRGYGTVHGRLPIPTTRERTP